MLRTFTHTAAVFLFSLSIIGAALPQLRVGEQPKPSQALPNGWTTHNDPMGFSVALPPAGWSISPDAPQGRVVLRGSRGEIIVVWPLSIEQPSIDSRGAAGLVLQLARSVDSQMLWTAGAATRGAVRAIARGSQRNGTAMMTWFTGAHGTSVLFYCVEAPADVYKSSMDTFVGILGSFRALPAGTNAAAANEPLRYVNWSDPRENAFSVAIPQGWHAVGGAYRLSPTDIRLSFVSSSADGQIRVVLGDSNLGSFIEPSQMLAMAGLREGMYYGLGDGTRLLIQRYLPGPVAARSYVQTYIARQCTGLQIESNNARQDLAVTFLQSARGEGISYAQLTAGDVTFTCSISGNSVRGTFVLATIKPFPAQATIWYVYRLYGYLASPSRVSEAESVTLLSLQSLRVNPGWQAQQSQIAGNAVMQDNMRSQQIQSRALQAIQEDQRAESDTIMKGWEQSQHVYDEISRRQENAILGTLDVVDPTTGQSYKVSNYNDYHWMNNEGYIGGNNTGESPSPDWHELVTLP